VRPGGARGTAFGVFVGWWCREQHSTHLSRGGPDRLPTLTSPVGRCCYALVFYSRIFVALLYSHSTHGRYLASCTSSSSRRRRSSMRSIRSIRSFFNSLRHFYRFATKTWTCTDMRFEIYFTHSPLHPMCQPPVCDKTQILTFNRNSKQRVLYCFVLIRT
jgi:hypothetical protein